ncbi:hypothetical protein [Deinococcus hopiensis]|uniref:hypothetical protein n=1 Tax=Deinococcus hopiensis TaxID=309885 RepID=UPI0014835523|nr:hypothetical protein [Deinococcus hopiensis]
MPGSVLQQFRGEQVPSDPFELLGRLHGGGECDDFEAAELDFEGDGPPREVVLD